MLHANISPVCESSPYGLHYLYVLLNQNKSPVIQHTPLRDMMLCVYRQVHTVYTDCNLANSVKLCVVNSYQDLFYTGCIPLIPIAL